jgi:hypothetical protein
VEIGEYQVDILINNGMSMSIILLRMVHTFGMMHLVVRTKNQKMTLGTMMNTMGINENLFTKVPGEITCFITIMMMDKNGYHLPMGLDFLMKIGVVIDMEKEVVYELEMAQG